MGRPSHCRTFRRGGYHASTVIRSLDDHQHAPVCEIDLADPFVMSATARCRADAIVVERNDDAGDAMVDLSDLAIDHDAYLILQRPWPLDDIAFAASMRQTNLPFVISGCGTHTAQS